LQASEVAGLAAQIFLYDHADDVCYLFCRMYGSLRPVSCRKPPKMPPRSACKTECKTGDARFPISPSYLVRRGKTASYCDSQMPDKGLAA